MADKKREPVRGYAGMYKIRRTKGVVYEIRYRARDDRGEWQQFSATFPTKEEAAAEMDERRAARRKGTHITPARGRRTFGDVTAQWLDSKDRKARTMKGYQHILDSWLGSWRHRQVSSITYDDCASVLVAMRTAGRHGQTVRNVYNVMRGVLDQAVEAGCIAVNPATPLRKRLPRSGERDVCFLTADQVATLSASLPAPYDLVVTFAAWSGLRAGEIAGMRVRNVDPMRRRVRVEETVVALRGGLQADTPKTPKSRRAVPLPASLAHLLADHIAARGLGPNDYMFGSPDGSPLNHGRFYQRIFKPAANGIGLPDLRFHDLRHTYASLMRPHLDMFELSRRMGHSTYRLTADTYSHLYETDDPTLDERLDAAFQAATTPSPVVARLVIA
ncbi:MAG: hypothetical protein QOI54_3195 [Actinomycetota bacterium]|nr:hypothetical protein [Actinomycetota bacterium]